LLCPLEKVVVRLSVASVSERLELHPTKTFYGFDVENVRQPRTSRLVLRRTPSVKRDSARTTKEFIEATVDDAPLFRQSFRLRHVRLGEAELFLVNQKKENVLFYEAVFNKLHCVI
jgi:hypothetical protein